MQMNRCSGAGNIRHDILHYKKKFEKCGTGDDETRSTLLDMGIKALRFVVLLLYENQMDISISLIIRREKSITKCVSFK